MPEGGREMCEAVDALAAAVGMPTSELMERWIIGLHPLSDEVIAGLSEAELRAAIRLMGEVLRTTDILLGKRPS